MFSVLIFLLSCVANHSILNLHRIVLDLYLCNRLASVLFLLSQGVQLFRIHNVNEVKQGILVYEEILTN